MPTARLEGGWTERQIRPNRGCSKAEFEAKVVPSSSLSDASETEGQKAQVWKQVKQKKRDRSKSHASCPNKRRNKSSVAVRKKNGIDTARLRS